MVATTPHRSTRGHSRRDPDIQRGGDGVRLPNLFRPSRYDPTCPACRGEPGGHADHRQVQAVLPELVGGGLPVYVAAGKCGVTRWVVADWLKRGGAEIEAMVAEQRDAPSDREAQYVAFVESVLFATADAQARIIGRWQTSARDSWKGMQAFMAEIWPDEFGRAARADVMVTVGPTGLGPVVPLEEIEERFARAARRLAAAQPDGDGVVDTTGRELAP